MVLRSDTAFRTDLFMSLASPSGVIRCSQIVPSDANGYADPYVSVNMEPAIVEKRSTPRKFKTSVKKKTLNPVFDQIFPFRELEVRDKR